MFLSLPLVALLLFVGSLAVVMVSAAWFTRRLEALCELFGLSIGILSLLGALGANIPNYAASVVALVAGHTGEGISIIVGSSIYNIAVILGLCTLASREAAGITLSTQEAQDARGVAWFTLPILLSITAVLALLPTTAPLVKSWKTGPAHVLLLLASMAVLALFSAFLVHLLRRSHPAPTSPLATHSPQHVSRSPWHAMRLCGEVMLALVIALLGVVVLVQSGQTVSVAVHLPQVFTGLVVLAVATSLPNTVVAVSLARTHEAAASVEEILSSNSINVALGMAFPLLLWQGALFDRSILFLDMPLTILLSLVMLAGVIRGRMNRLLGLALLCVYVVWVGVHLLL
jgi:cation:H+ antiporter